MVARVACGCCGSLNLWLQVIDVGGRGEMLVQIFF
jgi:hypothetical protein